MKNCSDSRLPELPQDPTTQHLAKTITKWLFEISCIPELSTFTETLALPGTVKNLYTKVLLSYQQYLNHKINQLRKLGRSPTCREGCAFCCHFMPCGLSSLEILFLYEAMHDRGILPRIFRRFLERQEVIEEISAEYRKRDIIEGQERDSPSEEILLSYKQKQIPCPLLSENHVCVLYSFRPLVCREYFSCSPPQWCDPSHPHHLHALRIALPLPEESQHMLDRIDDAMGFYPPETLAEALLVFSVNIAGFKPILWK